MQAIPSRAVLVTGGASGIGHAFCRQLAGDGYHIIIVDRDGASSRLVAAELATHGFAAEAHVGDVADERAMTALAELLALKGIALDMLILCAGDVHVGTLSELPDTDGIREDIRTDLWGTIVCCRSFLPLVRPRSRIVLISSGFGLMGAAGYAAYCAAKAGVIAFGEALRRELLFREIFVHVACPGDTDTPMLRREVAQQPSWMRVASARYTSTPPEAMARRILRKCRGDRFLVIVNPEIHFIAFVNRVLPSRLRNMLLDRMFARPKHDRPKR